MRCTAMGSFGGYPPVQGRHSPAKVVSCVFPYPIDLTARSVPLRTPGMGARSNEEAVTEGRAFGKFSWVPTNTPDFEVQVELKLKNVRLQTFRTYYGLSGI